MLSERPMREPMMLGLKFDFWRKSGKAGQAEPVAKPEYVIARLNSRTQPIDRGAFYEDPLIRMLESRGFGKVLGGARNLPMSRLALSSAISKSHSTACRPRLSHMLS